MVSSAAAAGETRARTNRLTRRICFIGRTLCTNAAPGRKPSSRRCPPPQDRLHDRPVVLADDVVARPWHEARPAGGELEAERRLPLGLAVGTNDPRAGELLDFGHHGPALGRGLAEPL